MRPVIHRAQSDELLLAPVELLEAVEAVDAVAAGLLSDVEAAVDGLDEPSVAVDPERESVR